MNASKVDKRPRGKPKPRWVERNNKDVSCCEQERNSPRPTTKCERNF